MQDLLFASLVTLRAHNRKLNLAILLASISANDPGGMNYTSGRWFFSINGAVYPSIAFNGSTGEMWRLLNGAAFRGFSKISLLPW